MLEFKFPIRYNSAQVKVSTFSAFGSQTCISNKGEADYFGVYSPDTGKVYLVPVDDVPGSQAKLRLQATKNNQQKGVRWAKDYRPALSSPVIHAGDESAVPYGA